MTNTDVTTPGLLARRRQVVGAYMKAFEQRDLARIADMFTDDVVLQDATVGRVSGHRDVLGIYAAMFSDATFTLTLGRSYDSPTGGMGQEFTLVVGNVNGSTIAVEGIDLFEFRDASISGIRAYVDSHELTAPNRP